MVWFEVKTLSDLKSATQELCKRLESQAIPQEKVYDCRLVVNELVGNVLRHSGGVAEVKEHIEGGCIEILVRSTESFIPPQQSKCSSVNEEGGRGLFLVDSVSISRTITSDGAIKVLIKY